MGLGIVFQVTNEVTSTVVVKYGVINFIWSELLINELYTSEYLPQITSGCYYRIYFFVNFAYKSLLFKLTESISKYSYSGSAVRLFFLKHDESDGFL